MQKYHIQITVHPIETSKNNEEFINTDKNNLSLISQGEGFNKDQVQAAIISLKGHLDTFNLCNEYSLITSWFEPPLSK